MMSMATSRPPVLVTMMIPYFSRIFIFRINVDRDSASACCKEIKSMSGLCCNVHKIVKNLSFAKKYWKYHSLSVKLASKKAVLCLISRDLTTLNRCKMPRCSNTVRGLRTTWRLIDEKVMRGCSRINLTISRLISFSITFSAVTRRGGVLMDCQP